MLQATWEVRVGVVKDANAWIGSTSRSQFGSK